MDREGEQAWHAGTPNDPRPDPPSAPQDTVLVQIGELACSQNWLLTPVGSTPLRHAQFMVRENISLQRRIPPYAIVLAILFFPACGLGLLFLLIQEDRVSGSIEVSVQAPNNFAFHTSVPVYSPAAAAEVRQQVEYCRQLVGNLG